MSAEMRMQSFETTLQGKKVLVTGHTGFTGNWLIAWLEAIGAQVSGLSLQPETSPNLWAEVGSKRAIDSRIGDIRDMEVVEQTIASTKPELVIHLAAQPLVRRSYADPIGTFSTNVMGTLNLLEVARHSDSVKGFVCVTTDKVYAPVDGRGLVEDDRLGGADPYSASKAAAEIVASSYRETMAGLANGFAVATVRGGNIIGGGDWSEDRIVPDFVRAWREGTVIAVRNPDAVRPWQHVLAACQGYLAIGATLISNPEVAKGAWNVGPDDSRVVTVRELLASLGKVLPQSKVEHAPSHLKETSFLCLNASKLRDNLEVFSPWDVDETIMRTAQWYRDYYSNPHEAKALMDAQLITFRHLQHTDASKIA